MEISDAPKDDDIDLSIRHDNAVCLKPMRQCCVGQVAFEALAAAETVSDLFQSPCKQMFRSLAYTISYLLSVADCERRHNKNKHYVTKKGLCNIMLYSFWRTFKSNYLIIRIISYHYSYYLL